MKKRIVLKKIGIECWSPRIQLPLLKKQGLINREKEESVLCYCYYWEKGKKSLACLLAQYGNGSLEEASLVGAIAKALPWLVKGGCQQVIVQKPRLPVLILGEELRAQWGLCEGKQVFVSYSPAELLGDEGRKRHCWKKLQELNLSLSDTQGF